MAQIVLYDIPSKDRCACWSPNSWKIRSSLNFKGLDYKTVWIEYPDIEPTLKSFAIPPNAPSTKDKPYTIPTARFCSSASSSSEYDYIMQSGAIAQRLEHDHPSAPSLHLDSPLLPQVEHLWAKVSSSLMGIWLPRVPRQLLTPRSEEFFVRTRMERFGKPLEQVEREMGGERAWANAEKWLKAVADLLAEGEGGPFFMGETPSYADLHVASWLHCFKRIDEEALLAPTLKMQPALGSLYEACGKWLERDDH